MRWSKWSWFEYVINLCLYHSGSSILSCPMLKFKPKLRCGKCMMRRSWNADRPSIETSLHSNKQWVVWKWAWAQKRECFCTSSQSHALFSFLHSSHSTFRSSWTGEEIMGCWWPQLPLTSLVGHERKYLGSHHNRGTLISAHQWIKCMFLQTRKRRLHQLPENMTALLCLNT